MCRISWRRRLAGDFYTLNVPQERRRDAGATKDRYVVAEKPPSITMISPLTKRLLVIKLTITSATSSEVAQRRKGVLFARRAIRSSYLSASIRFIQSPSIQPGATALTRTSGARFSARSLVRLTTAALLAA